MSSLISVLNCQDRIIIILSIHLLGYHSIYHLGHDDTENITITNNYLDGAGITRQWSTFGIWNTGGLNVLIGNNEVTRTSGGGIHAVSNSFKKGFLN